MVYFTKNSGFVNLKASRPKKNFDAVWKMALSLGAVEFIRMFYPKLFALLDLTKKLIYITMSGMEVYAATFYSSIGMRISDVIIVLPLKNGKLLYLLIEQQHEPKTDISERMHQFALDLMTNYPNAIVKICVVYTGPPDKPLAPNCGTHEGFYCYNQEDWSSTTRFPIKTALGYSNEELIKDNQRFSLIFLAWRRLHEYGDSDKAARERGYKELFSRAIKLGYHPSRSEDYFIFRFFWGIFIFEKDTPFANKIHQECSMNFITLSELNRLYPETIIEGYRKEFTAIGIEQGIEQERARSRELIRERNREQIRQKRQSQIDSAKIMLEANSPIDLIIRVTRLSKSKVLAIKAELERESADPPQPPAKA
ncbi:MAG: hypothetical protein LBT86_06775 [Deltaproteobacteria bacterium]|jgi:hypothetical protein|nr:hypothetical protein [Deltaproteobacteria bacterium]